MLNNFEDFINEARGFSEEAGAYAEVCIAEVNQSIDRYLSYNLSKGHFNYSDDIIIDNAYTKVSQEVASKFPVDQIKIMFRIASVTREAYQPYSAYYRRNYNKVKLKSKRGEKLNIEIQCKLVVPRKGGNLLREALTHQLREIFNHEMLHAYNDYRDPNFLKNYRLGIVDSYSKKAYPHIQKSNTLMTFFSLLYAMTDEEIAALSGEQREFSNMEEMMRSSGYEWAIRALEYNPDEFLESIEAQLAGTKYEEYTLNNFGEIFLNIYKKAAHHKQFNIDPKILRLGKDATLKDVLYFFEEYLHSQGKKLWRKMAAKVTQQGTGKLI
jgi:hypothetical protein